MGQTLASMGEFARALHHFQLVVNDYRTGKEDFKGRWFFVDEPVLALTYLARILWALGYPVRAVDAAQESIALARKGSNPASVATALVGRLFMAAHGAPLGGATAQAHEALAYCREHELLLYERWLNFICGAILVQDGDTAAGIERMQSAVSTAEASQNRQFRPFQLACIGTAYAKLGDHRHGLKMLDEAVSVAEAGGERQSLATIHRLRGEILSGLGQNRDAEAAFESALAIARRQGARLEELRIAIAMVRHATAPDDAGRTRRVLEDIYSTFEEGHELPDLRAARDLLICSALNAD
jgi:tetratricopeptide (TPR) repeat protein